jgi:glycosyltransferase involved in cell wall biosynthesis
VKKITIAYISEASPGDKHSWSGTVHYVFRALQNQNFNVIPLGPARPGFTRYLFAIANKASLLIFNKRIDYRHSKFYAKAFGKIFNRRLEKITYDLVVVCGNTECGSYLKTSRPIIYILDRTIAGAINYHTILRGLWEFSKHQSIETDRRAMRSSSMIFFSSGWAAKHAEDFYYLEKQKIRVVPFGANLDKVPSRELSLKSKDLTECKLLLVGTYWFNKGADIACNALQTLLDTGINASLTIVGCTPPPEFQGKIGELPIKIIPFVDKNSESGINTLWELFLSHHFFILPTRFDCTPIVYCEASAFGLPVLSSDTGGVRGHLKDGVNGFLLPYDDNGPGYAGKILELISDPGSYQRLCETTRDFYESDLNWINWGIRFREEIMKLA